MIFSLLVFFLGISTTLGTRTTLVQFQIQGVDSPFLAEYLYLSDCFLILTLLYATWKYQSSLRYVRAILTLTVLLSVFSLGSSYPILSHISSIRIGLIALATITIVQTRRTQWLVTGFLLGIIGQVGIGVAQMVTQASLGLTILGESTFSPELAGRAKLELLGRTLARIPGLYPHPNIFAAALLTALASITSRWFPKTIPWLILGGTLILMQIDHYFLSYVQGLWLLPILIVTSRTSFQHPLPKTTLLPILALANGAILLTGSKSALGLLILIQLGYLTKHMIHKMFHVEHFQKPWMYTSFPVATLVILTGIISFPFLRSLPTIQNRIFFISQIPRILSETWLTGIGLNQFITTLPSNLPLWRYQPVHNLPLLLWVELGILGIITFLGLTGYWIYTLWTHHHEQPIK